MVKKSPAPPAQTSLHIQSSNSEFEILRLSSSPLRASAPLRFNPAPVFLPRHTLVFTTPEDREEFGTYPAEEQSRLRVLWDAMMQIASAENPHQGTRAVAAAHPGWRGWSRQSLRTIYDCWVAQAHDWRTLIDRRRYPATRPGELPAHIAAKFSANQRVNAPAWRQIIRQWET